MQLRRLLPQESEFFFEQIDPMERVVGAEQSVQMTGVRRVLLDGVAVPQQQIATAFEDLLALGFQAVLLHAAHLVEDFVHHLGDVKAVVDDEHAGGTVLEDGREESSGHVHSDACSLALAARSMAKKGASAERSFPTPT